MGQPGIAADHAVVPDDGIPAEDCCVGVNNHMVSDVRMPLYFLDRIPVKVVLKIPLLSRFSSTLTTIDLLFTGSGIPGLLISKFNFLRAGLYVSHP